MEHIVQLTNDQRVDLIKWLKKPSGSHRTGTRSSLEAVVGGGVLIRTSPYKHSRDKEKSCQ